MKISPNFNCSVRKTCYCAFFSCVILCKEGHYFNSTNSAIALRFMVHEMHCRKTNAGSSTVGEKRDRRDSLVPSTTTIQPEKKRPKTEPAVPVVSTPKPLSPIRSPKQETPPPKQFIPNVPPITPKAEKVEPKIEVVKKSPIAPPKPEPIQKEVKKSPFKPKRAWLTEVAQAALDERLVCFIF